MKDDSPGLSYMENGLSKWIPIRILKPDWKRLVTAQMLSMMWSFFVHAKRFSAVGVKMIIPSSLSTVESVNILLPLPTELEPDLN